MSTPVCIARTSLPAPASLLPRAPAASPVPASAGERATMVLDAETRDRIRQQVGGGVQRRRSVHATPPFCGVGLGSAPACPGAPADSGGDADDAASDGAVPQQQANDCATSIGGGSGGSTAAAAHAVPPPCPPRSFTCSAGGVLLQRQQPVPRQVPVGAGDRRWAAWLGRLRCPAWLAPSRPGPARPPEQACVNVNSGRRWRRTLRGMWTWRCCASSSAWRRCSSRPSATRPA